MKKLILVDPNSDLCNEWETQFAGLPNVEIVNKRFEQLGKFDCMVSAANSFGLMDGGVDLAIISFFGIELMDRVQAMVIERFLGEQPVGTSVLVETGHRKTSLRRTHPDHAGTNAYFELRQCLLRYVGDAR